MNKSMLIFYIFKFRWIIVIPTQLLQYILIIQLSHYNLSLIILHFIS